MAKNQPTSGIPVVSYSDILNIPKPGVIVSGANTTAGTTLTDATKDFTRSATNAQGYIISSGDVVYDITTGVFIEIIAVTSATEILLSSAIAIGNYEIFKGNKLKSDGYSLFVGSGGDLILETVDGQEVTLKNVANNSYVPLQVAKVKSGTTALDIVALN